MLYPDLLRLLLNRCNAKSFYAFSFTSSSVARIYMDQFVEVNQRRLLVEENSERNEYGYRHVSHYLPNELTHGPQLIYKMNEHGIESIYVEEWFAYGEKHGWTQYYYDTGLTRGILYFIRGKLNGYGVRYDTDGQLTELHHYKNYHADGPSINYVNGRVISIWSYYRDMPTGTIYRYNPDGVYHSSIFKIRGYTSSLFHLCNIYTQISAFELPLAIFLLAVVDFIKLIFISWDLIYTKLTGETYLFGE